MKTILQHALSDHDAPLLAAKRNCPVLQDFLPSWTDRAVFLYEEDKDCLSCVLNLLDTLPHTQISGSKACRDGLLTMRAQMT